MPDMTPLARLLTAFRCGQPDRVPIIVRGVNPYARHMNWRGEADPSYRTLIERVRADCEVEHILSMGRGFGLNAAAQIDTRVELRDGWRVITRSVETPAGPLTSIHREGTDSYAHAEVKQWIADEADVERFLSLPYRPVEPDLAPYFAARDQLGEGGYVLAYLDDAIGQVHALMGSELLAIWSVEAPGLIHRLLDVMGERCLDFARRLLEGGVAPVLGLQGQEVVVPPLMSPRRFAELVVRYDRPIVELAHAPRLPALRPLPRLPQRGDRTFRRHGRGHPASHRSAADGRHHAGRGETPGGRAESAWPETSRSAT